MSSFSVFFFRKLRKTGRSNGRITIRHRGGGYFKKISKILSRPYVNHYSIFTFLHFLNFSNQVIPIYTYILSKKTYLLFSQNFFNGFTHDELASKSFFLYQPYFATSILDDEFKPFKTSFYLTNFLNVSNSMFIRFLNRYPIQNFQYARSKNTFARFLKTRGSNAIVKLPSGKIISFSKFSSFLGLGYKHPNFFFQLQNFQKKSAGYIRNMGIRPHVRGVAINPVDHPHGGRTGESRPSVSPWAQLTKGYPTRSKNK